MSRRPPQLASPLPSPAHLGRASEERGEDAFEQAPRAALDFEQVYTAHFHEVCRWSRALGGLDADLDDLAQEVFLVVRRKLGTFNGPSLAAWLYGITRKTVSDYRRRAWLRRVLAGLTRSLDAAPPQPDAGAHDPYERVEARRRLGRVLERMRPLHRTAFILFEIEGYSGPEIAELEQIPVATVYTRLHHAKKDFVRLVAELDQDGDHADDDGSVVP